MNRSRLFRQVFKSNQHADGALSRWAPHRAQVMKVLGDVPVTGSRLALLGAGHLYDVELDDLTRRYRSIALVDLDAETVSAALRRHPGAAGRCLMHAPLDLTGVFPELERVSRRPAGVDGLMAQLAVHRCEIPSAPFDVTVSLGVLTQLMQAVTDAGIDPNDVPRVSLAVRDKHLRDLVRLTQPGGTLAVITDIVSTASAPELIGVPPDALEEQMVRLIAAGNFFTGTNPYRIAALLEETEPFREYVGNARFTGPWLWAITPDRQHLAGAIVADRNLREFKQDASPAC